MSLVGLINELALARCEIENRPKRKMPVVRWGRAKSDPLPPPEGEYLGYIKEGHHFVRCVRYYFYDRDGSLVKL